MSRQPSPGPSQPLYANNTSAPAPNRQKSKTYTPGIAAGAEDAKYKAKYKELKKKVKEIEADNDKLLFKTLQAKRNIQRMRIERAILYERLSTHPPSPRMHERQPPPNVHGAPPPSQLYPSHHAPPRPHHPREAPYETNLVPVDPGDPAALEYYRSHGAAIRVVSGHDGQPVTVAEFAAPPPPPQMHARHSSGHRTHAPPMAPSTSAPHLEPPRAYAHSHSPSTSAHSHSRSRSRHAHGYPPPAEYAYSPEPPHVHAHQRVGPGANINNYGQPEREPEREARDREREREWEAERERRIRAHGEAGPSGTVYTTRIPTPPFAMRPGSPGRERERERERERQREREYYEQAGYAERQRFYAEREQGYAERERGHGGYEREHAYPERERGYERERRHPGYLEREREMEAEARPGSPGHAYQSEGAQSRSDVEGDVDMEDVSGRGRD